jgi:hypothetical protein
MPEVFGGAQVQWSEPEAMQTSEYHFVTDSKNALFTDDNLSPKCTDQVPATRISKPLDQNQRLMEVPILNIDTQS